MIKKLLNAAFDVSDRSRSVWINGVEKIYPSDIRNALKSIGLKQGDVLMPHFDLSVFGKLGDIRERDDFFNVVINAILSVIGEDGALIIPAFSYSLCKNETFDINSTLPTIGQMAEVALKRYKENLELDLGLPIFRSSDPIFSCIGFGKKAGSLFNAPGTFCFGDNSVFGRLYEHDAVLMGFGFEFAVTYMHFVERRYNDLKRPLIYRFNKTFKGGLIGRTGDLRDVEYTYFVRDLQYCDYDFKKIPEELERKSLLNKIRLGSGMITSSTAKDLYNTIFEILDKDLFGLLTEDCRNDLLRYLAAQDTRG